MARRIGANRKGTSALQGSHKSTETRLEVQKLNELPAMSLVVHQFLQVANDSDAEVRQIAAIIEKDPALLARIIGLANSAYYGYPEPVTRAEDAIFRVLGLNVAKSLALSIILSGPFDASHCPGFRLKDYWATAMLTASFAQHLARHVTVEPRPSPNDAYLAGLLHNIGLLAMVHLYPEAMQRVFAAAQGQPVEVLLESEYREVGATHPEVGGWLARKWHLPDNVVAVIEHYPSRDYLDGHWPMVRLVGVCAQWVRAAWVGPDETPELDGPLHTLGIQSGRIQRAADRLQDRWDEIRGLADIVARG